jgi:ubiquinone/menaquinone biosynthesis C-methylase UbiE
MTRGNLMRDSSFKVMSLIHDNPLRRRFDDPFKTLKSAGVAPGQQVLEIGCGPGFFTIPAAEIVGESGKVHALDVVPRALETVETKLRKARLTNVNAIVADAADTGLPDDSIDVILLFGVLHALSLKEVLPELHRVLKQEGVVAVQGGFRGKGGVEKGGLFTFAGSEGGITKFIQKRRKEVRYPTR